MFQKKSLLLQNLHCLSSSYSRMSCNLILCVTWEGDVLLLTVNQISTNGGNKVPVSLRFDILVGDEHQAFGTVVPAQASPTLFSSWRKPCPLYKKTSED